LPRRHVRAARLDHVTAATLEVEEAVRVDNDEISGPVPAVGGEYLVALAAVVALHHERTAEPELARLAGCAPRARVGVDDGGLEPGRGSAEGAASLLGLVGL